MKITTKELENRIERMQNIDELREMLSELPKTTFYDRINELLNEHNMTPAQIIKATGMTKSLVYDILSERGKRKPQKHQIIRIGLAIGLSVEEVNELLKLANHKELYAKNDVDAIIIFGIRNNLPDDEIEKLLLEAGCSFSLFA